MPVLVCVVGMLPTMASAQVSSAEEPGHQAERFAQPLAAKARPPISIALPSSTAPAGAAAISFRLSAVNIVGGTVYPASALAPLYADLVGKDVSLADVYALAQKITQKYGNDGYVLSRAIVPPQSFDPKAATVTIKIVEGYVDQVQWPAALGGYAEFTKQYTTKITGEHPANLNTIMRYLLLADDWPGVHVSSRFEASATNSDASTLVVDAAEKPVAGSAEIDNRGTEARGPWELLLNTTFDQPAQCA